MPASPRTVHLIWLGSSLPLRLNLLLSDVARHDPDVDVRVWTDGDLSWLKNRELLEQESLFAAKADIARYEILNRYGGLYLDADFRVHRSLADVFASIDRYGLVVARQSRTVYTNAFLGAIPGHPLLADLVDGLADSVHWTGRMTEPAVTGPHYLTAGIVAYVRAGGRALELPQHSVFPWSTDEEPIPASALPASTLMSHDWSSLRGWSWHDIADEPSEVPVPDRASRRRRTGRRPRARAAATPLAHRAIAAVEAWRLAPPRAHDTSVSQGTLSPTDRAIERWTARCVAHQLRGSARFVDLYPRSLLPLMTASRMLDRPGSALAVVDDRPGAEMEAGWRDPSIRCSVHLAFSDGGSSRISDIQSAGSAVTARELGTDVPPIGCRTGTSGLTVSELMQSLPRTDLVRVPAERLTPDLAEALTELTSERRIGRLLVVIDPLSHAPGVAAASMLLARLDGRGLRMRLGPWLVDGRGRAWWAHLRVAARPFVVAVG